MFILDVIYFVGSTNIFDFMTFSHCIKAMTFIQNAIHFDCPHIVHFQGAHSPL